MPFCVLPAKRTCEMYASQVTGRGTKGRTFVWHILQHNYFLTFRSFKFSKIGMYLFSLIYLLAFSLSQLYILSYKIIVLLGFVPVAGRRNRGRNSRGKKKRVFAMGGEYGLNEDPSQTKLFRKAAGKCER